MAGKEMSLVCVEWSDRSRDCPYHWRMFTLFHCGQVVGTTDFAHAGPAPHQRLGQFQPTEYGLTVLPRITGLLEAAFGLKRALERDGIDPEGDPDVITEALERLPEGQRVIDVGRAISELELRNEHGHVITFASLAISDVKEMLALARGPDEANEGPDESREETDDLGDWQYLISATFIPARVPDASTAVGWLHRPGTRN